nr:DUF397 domain-containing protein [Streptomyces pini]
MSACRRAVYGPGSEGGECVEMATAPGTVHVRDSKDRRGPVLHSPADGRTAFVSSCAAKR